MSGRFLNEGNFVSSRRDVAVVAAAAFVVVLLLGVGFGVATAEDEDEETPPFIPSAKDYRPKGFGQAMKVLRRAPIIDGHNDLPYTFRELLQNDLSEYNFSADVEATEPFASAKNALNRQTDLPKLREGRVGGQFWAAYFPCKAQYKDATAGFLEQIDVIKRFVAKYPDDLQFATSVKDILWSMKNSKIASLIGVEGGHAIDGRLGVLRTLYDVGVRYMTLTHVCNTPWADAAQSENASDPNFATAVGGLTPFGELVVLEMNRLGMAVDLSHVSAAAMRDALRVAQAPVIFSHSSARSVNPHPRNVPDVVLEKVAVNGGIVMVNFVSDYVYTDSPELASIADVVKHINRIRKVAGVDHVGIGADYNGVNELCIGLENVSKYPNLFAALISDEEEPWTPPELIKLASGNILRVLTEIEKVRDAFKDKDPIQEWIDLEEYGNNTKCLTE